uniref:NFX1-type zinc finger-containing protein 1 n=1 Tax=Sphenodon punctatus TaxID=8508 RepID=A0A8D0HP35_SPHPU
MAGQKRKRADWDMGPYGAARLSPVPGPFRRQEPGELVGELERLCDHSPNQLLPFLLDHDYELRQELDSPDLSPASVYTLLRALKQAVERAGEPAEAQPILALVLRPAFVLRSLLGFIAELASFRCQDGQVSQEVLEDTVAALHHLLTASLGQQVQTLLCHPVDLLFSTVQRLQSRSFQFTWIIQKRLRDAKLLVDNAFPRRGAPGAEGLHLPAWQEEDFHQIPVFPTPEEIFVEPTQKLRRNRIRGRYESDASYLDTHFRLLREDLIKPLRDGISARFALRNLFSDARAPTAELRLYQSVQLLKVGTSPTGVTYLAQFHTQRRCPTASKWLMSGSLVCLISNDSGHVFFGTVAGANRQQLLPGAVWLEIRKSHGTLLQHLGKTSFTMVESPAFFEAYRHVLEGLQEMSPTCVPFRKYIVKCSPAIAPPAYLEGGAATFDLSTLGPPAGADDAVAEDVPEDEARVKDLTAVSPFHAHLWSRATFPHLDESQIQAIRAALSQEFVLIQGPPGTGKTFIGLKILEILLRNQESQREERKPFLVVCYTNHALDQFLEGILRFQRSGVVRIGGRSKNEKVMSCSLRNLRQRQLPQLLVAGDRQQYGRMLSSLRWQKESIAYRMEVLQLLQKGILSAEELGDEIRKDQLSPPPGGMLKWLMINPPEDRQRLRQLSSRKRGREADLFVPQERLLEEEEEEEGELDALDEPKGSAKGKFDYIIPAESSTSQGWMLTCLKEGAIMTNEEIEKIRDIWSLRRQDRWRLYRRWLVAYESALKESLVQKLDAYKDDAARLAELTFQEDLRLLQHSQVIGMTTTGDAKYRKLLQNLQPRVVIVEEAAEILEAHVLTSLTPACQHLILIGDHQQLRPKPADYTLEKKYFLGISLFERMVNNGIPYVQLLCQHRMRPDISQLLVPFFYKELRDHQVVTTYENIKGLERNVYFIQHTEKESHNAESESYSNKFEASFLALLSRYLLKQGYQESQITILTPYHGQVLKIRALMNNMEVAVHAVDDFQGEENDIVLLSLVRSNSEGRIGFLKDKNRLCVALSRAKKGFYCIGNLASISESSKLWKEIVNLLKARDLTGKGLTLMCQNHPDTKTVVKESSDFAQIPDGGCTLKCETRLACGHPCTRRCHPYDRNHHSFVCQFPCSKTLCKLNHKCPRKCNEACKPCDVKVEKIISDCGHSQMVPCHVPADVWICKKPCTRLRECKHPCPRLCGEECSAFPCKELVELLLPCSHIERTECFKRKIPLRCFEKCKQKLECGHLCKGSCHECVRGRLHIDCSNKCRRVLLCSHQCRESCFENCPPCKSPCRNRCQHSQCDKPCGEICFPCHQPCSWKCQHYRCSKLCSEM